MRFKRILSTAVVACSLSLSAGPVPAGAGPAGANPAGPVPAGAATAPGVQTCPQVVVIAARGSDQNAAQGEYLGPQTYGGRKSNGFEGRNFISFFHFVDQRYPEVMKDVQVIGLDDKAYPASMGVPALAEEGESLDFLQILQRLGDIARKYSLGQLAYNTTFGVLDSLRQGQVNAPKVVAEYERRSGCRPSYIVAGYSQGAIVSTSLESHLYSTGRLLGALSLGNPLAQPRGMAVLYPHFPAPLAADKRIDYCLSGDFSCDFTVPNIEDALKNKAERHASYFLDAAQGDPSPQDEMVAEQFVHLLQARIKITV